MKQNISKKTWFAILPYCWHEHHHSVRYVSLTDIQYTHSPKKAFQSYCSVSSNVNLGRYTAMVEMALIFFKKNLTCQVFSFAAHL